MPQFAAEARPTGFIYTLISRIGRPVSNSRQQVIVVAFWLGLLLTLGATDIMTGPQVHVGLLYVVPVLGAAWFGGRASALILSISACTVWYHAGRPASDGDGILLNGLNLLIRETFYIILSELVGRLRQFNIKLEQSVQQRTAQLRQEVAERKRAEESLRTLAGQLSAAEDVERRRIAYDIHDALSQMLGVVKMNLETAVAETAIDSRQFERLSDVVKVVDDLIRQTREMTFDLHPSMLDHFGLVPTLQRFAEEFQRRTMAEVTITESGDRLTLSNQLASYMFRAIKEVVNNAVKHGNAKEIIVAIHWIAAAESGSSSGQMPSGQMRCVVDDDGRGFDPSKAMAPSHRRGLGLAGIDERLTSLGGRLSVESQPGGGARLILEVPMDNAPALV